MKKLVFLGAMFLAVCSSYGQRSVESQYPGDELANKINQEAIQNQIEGKKASSTTWVDNRARDNWFISGFAGLGGSLTGSIKDAGKPFNAFDSDKDGFWKLSYGGAFGKWYSPTYGFRITGKYGETSTFHRDANDNYALSANAEYIAGNVDFMVNLKNLFTHYNPKAFFNPVAYVGPGLVYTLGDTPEGGTYQKHQWNISMNAGLQLNFRLHDRWDLFLDANAALYPTNFDRDSRSSLINSDVVTTASLGLTYKFNFRHFIAADFNDPTIVDGLNNRINELRRENEQLRNRPIPVCPPCPEEEKVVVIEEKVTYLPTPVFFEIGSAVIMEKQMYAIEEAVKYLKENPRAQLHLTGYADRETGTPGFNQQLSQERVDAVAKKMVDRYGIDRSRLVTNAKGDTVQPFEENNWNRVVVFVTE
ncbi:OmpA family protein [Bacteroidales bacterium OttesenSCG-928-L03]|nr:OmpA family protein [Bacteroidales bacterium OttesenSCG-928-L03]